MENIISENDISKNDIKINDSTMDSIVIGATIDYMGNVTELAKLEGKGWYSAYIINSDGSLAERRKFSKSEFAEAFNVFGENGSTGDNNLFYLPDLQNRTKRHIGENILYKELQNFATSLNGISAATTIAGVGDHGHDMAHEHKYNESVGRNAGGIGNDALDKNQTSSTYNCSRNVTGGAGAHTHNATTILSGGAIETRGNNFGVITLFKLKNAKIASLNRFDKLMHSPVDNIFVQNTNSLDLKTLGFLELLNQGDLDVVFKNSDGSTFSKYYNQSVNAFVPFDIAVTSMDLLPKITLATLNIRVRVYGVFDMASSTEIKSLSMSLLDKSGSLLDTDYAMRKVGDTNKAYDFNFVAPLGDRTVNEGFNFVLQNVSGNDLNVSKIEIFLMLN